MNEAQSEQKPTAQAAPAQGMPVPQVGEQMPFAPRLEAFEGPLDLLLYLIKENEVEITAIPIAGILQQYLTFLDVADQWDLHLAGEFLVMATTLMEIKSRELLPVEEQISGDEIIEDPRSELVRQLLQYRRLKDQARFLEQRRATWIRQRPRGLKDDVPEEPVEEVVEGEGEGVQIDFDLYALFAAFHKVNKSVLSQAPRNVQYDGEPMEEKIARIERVLQDRPFSRFSELVHDPSSRADIAMTFVALLELIRRRMIRILEQENLGDFDVRVITEEEAEELSRSEAEEAEKVVDLAVQDKRDRETQLKAEAAAQGIDVDKLSFQQRRAILSKKKFEGLAKPEDIEEIDAEDAEIGKRIDAILAAADVISQRFEAGREADVAGSGLEGATGADGSVNLHGLPQQIAIEEEEPVSEEDLEPRPEADPDESAADSQGQAWLDDEGTAPPTEQDAKPLLQAEPDETPTESQSQTRVGDQETAPPTDDSDPGRDAETGESESAIEVDETAMDSEAWVTEAYMESASKDASLPWAAQDPEGQEEVPLPQAGPVADSAAQGSEDEVDFDSAFGQTVTPDAEQETGLTSEAPSESQSEFEDDQPAATLMMEALSENTREEEDLNDDDPLSERPHQPDSAQGVLEKKAVDEQPESETVAEILPSKEESAEKQA